MGSLMIGGRVRARLRQTFLLVAVLTMLGALTPSVSSAQSNLSLSDNESRLLLSRYGSGFAGRIPTGRTVTLADSDNDGKISTGDDVTVRNRDGSVFARRDLSEWDVYDLLLRGEIVEIAQSIGRGWITASSGEFVDINGADLANPETRSYTAPFNSGSGTERVVERNQFWEVVVRDGARYMVQRQGTSAAAAVDDWFNNPGTYNFECGGAIPVIHLKALRNILGADQFDEGITEPIVIRAFYDGYNPRFANSNRARWDSGLGAWHYRNAEANEVVVNGVGNLAGELALFNPQADNPFGQDKLQIGTMHYFDIPGDSNSLFQGYNAYYLGQYDGGFNFWTVDAGLLTVDFAPGKWIPTQNGTVQGGYLGSLQRDPDAGLLRLWDNQNLAG